jgi:hypothetical protein
VSPLKIWLPVGSTPKAFPDRSRKKKADEIERFVFGIEKNKRKAPNYRGYNVR